MYDALISIEYCYTLTLKYDIARESIDYDVCHMFKFDFEYENK